jgi:hypothetical protein
LRPVIGSIGTCLRYLLATRFIERARTLLLVNDVLVEDKAENESSLKYGLRLMSSYRITETKKLWVITEADRSVTTLLLPAEY